MRLIPVLLYVFTFGFGTAFAQQQDQAAGKRYSSTLDGFLHQQNLSFVVPWQQQFVQTLIERIDELPFNKIAENPLTAQKMSKIGARLLANKDFVSSLAKAEGVDFVSLMTRVAGVISDTEKMRHITNPAELKKTRDRLYANSEKLLSDQALQRALRNSLIKHGDFLAKIVTEEKLVTETLGQKEFLQELAKYEEGVLIAKIIHIPTALKTLEVVVARVLSDEELLKRLFEQKTQIGITTLAANMQDLFLQLSSTDNSVTIEKINSKTLEVMSNMIDSGEVIGRILSAVTINPEDIDPAVLKNKCRSLKYADSKTDGLETFLAEVEK